MVMAQPGAKKYHKRDVEMLRLSMCRGDSLGDILDCLFVVVDVQVPGCPVASPGESGTMATDSMGFCCDQRCEANLIGLLRNDPTRSWCVLYIQFMVDGDD